MAGKQVQLMVSYWMYRSQGITAYLGNLVSSETKNNSQSFTMII